MESLALFMIQFLWFFAVWSVLAFFVIWPWSLQLSANARLRFWLAPQMFRAPGLGLAFMIVAHVACLAALLRSRTQPQAPQH